MLINLTNHPSSQWSDEQLITAKQTYGNILDLEFPEVGVELVTKEINGIAEQYLGKCINILKNYQNEVNAIHIMGEHTFTYAFVKLAEEKNVKCISSTTVRNVYYSGDEKITNFRFRKFRDYFIFK